MVTKYHASAVIASALDNIIYPMKMRKDGFNAGYLSSFLNWRRDTKLVDLSVRFPLQVHANDTVKQASDQWSDSKVHSVSGAVKDEWLEKEVIS